MFIRHQIGRRACSLKEKLGEFSWITYRPATRFGLERAKMTWIARLKRLSRTRYRVGLCILLAASTAPAADNLRDRIALMKGLGHEVVELRSTSDNRLYSSGRLNGNRCSFLLDTGWSYTTVCDESSRDRVVLGEIKLAQTTFVNEPARSQRVRMGGKRPSFDVILGLDFFRRHAAVIDCGNRRLFTRTKPMSREDAEVLTAELRRLGYVPVTLTIQEGTALTCPGAVPEQAFEFLVDTGAAWSCLDWTMAEANGWKARPSTTQVSGEGRTGTRSLPITKVTSLRIGTLKIQEATLGLIELPDWGLAEAGKKFREVKGLLGGELLAAHRAIIDCGQLRLWLKVPSRK